MDQAEFRITVTLSRETEAGIFEGSVEGFGPFSDALVPQVMELARQLALDEEKHPLENITVPSRPKRKRRGQAEELEADFPTTVGPIEQILFVEEPFTEADVLAARAQLEAMGQFGAGEEPAQEEVGSTQTLGHVEPVATTAEGEASPPSVINGIDDDDLPF